MYVAFHLQSVEIICLFFIHYSDIYAVKLDRLTAFKQMVYRSPPLWIGEEIIVEYFNPFAARV